MEYEIKDLIKQLTLEEKARLCSGKDFWHLEAIEKFNLPSIMVTDGPHGLRKQGGSSDHIGLADSVKATCFPTAVGLASSWDNDLLYQVGEKLGAECVSENVSVLLGPGVNIKRHPLCGRNFEYFSEDPILSGHLAASFINGVQSKGVGTSLKHYVANNQETMRMAVDTIIDERTLRELYLKGFEIAVKEAQPWTVMCSYNKVNGTYLSEHKQLLNNVLKEEWKHEGLVVTDWGACNDRVDGLIAGLELEMPGNNGINDKYIIEAVQSGKLSEEILDQRVERILDLIIKSKKTLSQEPVIYDKDKHHAFARKVAGETVVLLKNENNILPLNKNQKVALIGEFAVKPRYQGSGSSLINPTKLTNAFDAFNEVLQDNLVYAQGYHSNKDKLDHKLLLEAVKTAQEADVVVLMVGLTNAFESEGFDRTHLNIPNNHLRLIEEVTKVNKNVIVALSNGSPVAMPWKDSVPAIIEQYLGGQASGEALCDVVFGKVNPSGKLAETFPNNLEEIPSNQHFPGLPRQVQYREGLYVGYRYYDSVGKEPLYPFGYGLSYTTFEYSDLQVDFKDDMVVTFNITNTGDKTGKEISQVYLTKGDSKVYRPKKELKGYAKTELQPGETKLVQIVIPRSHLEVFQDEFKLENGTYHILVGASSVDIRLKSQTDITSGTSLNNDDQDEYKNINESFKPLKTHFEKLLGHNIPSYPEIKPFNMNSVLGEMKDSFIGKKLYKTIVENFKSMTGDSEESETISLMIESMVHEMPFRNIVRMSGGAISERKAQGLLNLMNKKPFRGLWNIIKG